MPIVGFRTRLNLDNKQKTLCAKHAGVARHSWNWALEYCNLQKTKGLNCPSAIDLNKLLVATVKKENPWYYEVSKCAAAESIRNLRVAFDRFFKKISRYPKFKKKGDRDAFRLEGPYIKIEGKRIRIPFLGWVSCFEDLPVCKPKSCTISYKASNWYISFNYEIEIDKAVKSNLPSVGVDVGINTLATLSSGRVFNNPKPFRTNLPKLKRLQRKLAKQLKGGSNREKTKLKLQKVYSKITNTRLDSLHKLTTYLAKNHSRIAIEDLSVSGMLKNPKLSLSLSDAALSKFRVLLTYKCEWYGSQLDIVDRFFPSSKTCSGCGVVKTNQQLKDKIFNCSNCGLVLDRDLNAAINLEKYTPGLEVSACEGAVILDESQVSPAEAGTYHSKLTSKCKKSEVRRLVDYESQS